MPGININNDSWHNWTSSSIQTLFSGFKTTGVSGLASLTGDYSSIRNGSYGKLVRAYYDKIDSENNNLKKTNIHDKLSQIKKDEKSKATKEENQVSSDSKSLTNSIDKLQKEGVSSVFNKTYNAVEKSYDYNKDKIYNAVNDFVKSYNSLLDSTDKLNSDSADKKISNMVGATADYNKDLEKIGISVNKDSKLVINKDAFKKSNMEDVKKLFTGAGSYGSQVNSQANSINKLVTTPSSYNNEGKYANSKQNELFSSYI